MILIRLNKTTFIKHVIQEVNKELDKVATVLVEYMIGVVAQIPYSGSVEAVGKPEWRRDVIDALNWKSKHIVGQALTRRIGVISQKDNIIMKAMIVEFGMGDLADTTNNPWIKDYFGSEYYHSSERNGMKVYGRKDKDVYNIDYDWWEESQAWHDNEIPYFHQVGSKFWRTVFGEGAKLAEIYLNEALSNAFKRINVSQFVTSTIKKK